MNDQTTQKTAQLKDYHKHVILWLTVGFLSLIVLFLMAFAAQRSGSLQLSFTPPPPTPTPISSGNIVVTSPHADEHVAQSFTVTGRARVAKNLVWIRLRDKYSGQVITAGHVETTAGGPGKFGDFSADLAITDEVIRSESPLLLDVYQVSPQNGKEVDKLTIPLVFSPVSL